jgi:hypothetical protein
MTTKQKYLLIGGVGLGALALWWFGSHQAAAAAIVQQPPVPRTVLPVVIPVAAGGTNVPPVGTNTNAAGQDTTQLNALLAWTNGTAKPSLYAKMISALTPSQLSSLYNILTTDWQGSGQPTVAQTAFWNSLTAQYPFLKAPNPGTCTNFLCN